MNARPLQEVKEEPLLDNQTPLSLEAEILMGLIIEGWKLGPNLDVLYGKLNQEAKEAVANEKQGIAYLRAYIKAALANTNHTVPVQKWGRFTVEDIRKAHYGLLFGGKVEAVDGNITNFETLPLSLSQIGISMVSYQGELGTYSHRIFRKDLKVREGDPLQEAKDFLQRRQKKGSRAKGNLTQLARRGLMAFAERRILLEEAKAPWRMGHGSPIPLEMLTDYWATQETLLREALAVLRQLIDHKKFVFVTTRPGSMALLTIGNALQAREYLVLGPVKENLLAIIERKQPVVDTPTRHFIDAYGEQVVYGLYRASEMSPAMLFYAHRDYVELAALIAVADSLLHEHRGFPMLLDLANSICKSTFHPETFQVLAQQSFALAGEPFAFGSLG